MSESSGSNLAMESLINEFISRELVSDIGLLPLKNNTKLLESKILDSLSLLKLVTFIEQRFDIVIGPEELVPENFESINALSVFLRSKQNKKS